MYGQGFPHPAARQQAGLQGAQVRVFVDGKEALAWLYKDFPSAILAHQG
jgi:hypothetical protein